MMVGDDDDDDLLDDDDDDDDDDEGEGELDDGEPAQREQGTAAGARAEAAARVQLRRGRGLCEEDGEDDGEDDESDGEGGFADAMGDDGMDGSPTRTTTMTTTTIAAAAADAAAAAAVAVVRRRLRRFRRRRSRRRSRLRRRRSRRRRQGQGGGKGKGGGKGGKGGKGGGKGFGKGGGGKGKGGSPGGKGKAAAALAASRARAAEHSAPRSSAHYTILFAQLLRTLVIRHGLSSGLRLLPVRLLRLEDLLAREPGGEAAVLGLPVVLPRARRFRLRQLRFDRGHSAPGLLAALRLGPRVCLRRTTVRRSAAPVV